MTAPIVQTFESLKKRRVDCVWVWSMLLTRGLTWDNVWDVYRGGVAAHTGSAVRVDRVPGVEMLTTLPEGPTNILEVFNRLRHVRAHYPEVLSNNEVLKIDDVAKGLLRTMYGDVQCTWPQVKAILDSTQLLKTDDERVDVSELLALLGTHSTLRDKALVHMAKTQHRFVGMYSFVKMASELSDQKLTDIWNNMRLQPWAHPENTVDFLHAFTWTTGCQKLPVNEVLDFVGQHPSIVGDMERGIVAHGTRLPKDDAFFKKTNALLTPYPEAQINLHVAMEREMSLERLRMMMGNHNEPIAMKSLLLAHSIMPLHERDTAQAQSYFSELFQRVQVRTQNYANDHCNALMATLTTESPTGTMARILALHACTMGLFTNECHEDDIKQFRAMFKHDPTSKTGHASIIRKVIPDLKEWFTIVQGLGLNREDIWQQGLHSLMHPAAQPDLTIDPALFDEATQYA